MSDVFDPDLGEEYDAIVEQILRGEDDFAVPEELLEDAEKPEEINEEKLKSLHAQIGAMSVGEKIKLALKGGREARSLLLRDANKLVQRLVLQNPRISEEEIVAICKNRTADIGFLEKIAKDREWSQSYQVRLALTTNPKTPLVFALKFVRQLNERDLRQLAKSKNIPGAVNSAAKRVLFEKQSKS